MKRWILSLFLLLTPWISPGSLQAGSPCHVVAKSGTDEGSLPWQVERVHQGLCTSVLFTLMQAPLKVTLQEALWIEDDHSAMISGADYSVDAPWPPLGVVIDARALEGCAIYIEKPASFSVKSLSVWVNDWDEAICDFQGRPILRQGGSAYVGDALMGSHYSQLQICEGPNQTQSCTMAPMAPTPSIPKGPGELKNSPQPPIPPGPDGFQNCSDRDQDGLCDSVDRCDLSPQNALAPLLAGIIAHQCLEESLASRLCSQTDDVDQDGYGNACDLDSDGDGFLNEEEINAGSDPLDTGSFPQPDKPGEDGSQASDSGDSAGNPQPDTSTRPDQHGTSGPQPAAGDGCQLQPRTARVNWGLGAMMLLSSTLAGLLRRRAKNSEWKLGSRRLVRSS